MVSLKPISNNLELLSHWLMQQLTFKIDYIASNQNFVYRTKRLYKAKELLLNSQMNISEVAYKVGFKDPNYFTHVFVEKFGITPSATRK